MVKSWGIRYPTTIDVMIRKTVKTCGRKPSSTWTANYSVFDLL